MFWIKQAIAQQSQRIHNQCNRKYGDDVGQDAAQNCLTYAIEQSERIKETESPSDEASRLLNVGLKLCLYYPFPIYLDALPSARLERIIADVSKGQGIDNHAKWLKRWGHTVTRRQLIADVEAHCNGTRVPSWLAIRESLDIAQDIAGNLVDRSPLQPEELLRDIEGGICKTQRDMCRLWLAGHTPIETQLKLNLRFAEYERYKQGILSVVDAPAIRLVSHNLHS